MNLKKHIELPYQERESRGRTCSDYAEAQRDCKQSLNYIELPIKEQARSLRQGPRRGGRKGVAPLNKGLSRSD